MEGNILYHFILGSLLFFHSCFLCNHFMQKTKNRSIVFFIVFVFYGAVAATYFYTPFSQLLFSEYILGILPILILPFLYQQRILEIASVVISNLFFALLIVVCSNALIQPYVSALQQYPFLQAYSMDQILSACILCSFLLYAILSHFTLRKTIHCLRQTKAVSILSFLFYLCTSFLFLYYINFFTYSTTMSDQRNIGFLLLFSSILLIGYIVICIALTTQPLPVAQAPVASPPKPLQRKVAFLEQLLQSQTKQHYQTLIQQYKSLLTNNQNIQQQLQAFVRHDSYDLQRSHTSELRNIQKLTHAYPYYQHTKYEELDVLLSYYIYQCEKANIYFEVCFQLPTNDILPIQDICTILGICLDNAIEASHYIDPDQKRHIQLKAFQKDGYWNLHILNYFDGFINCVDQNLRSRKKEGGVGLKVLQLLLTKYRGKMRLEYPNDQFSLTLQLPLSHPTSSIDHTNSYHR